MSVGVGIGGTVGVGDGVGLEGTGTVSVGVGAGEPPVQAATSTTSGTSKAGVTGNRSRGKKLDISGRILRALLAPRHFWPISRRPHSPGSRGSVGYDAAAGMEV